MIYFYYQNTMELQLIGFSYDKKSANVVMWKDKEYEYISSAWNNNNKELTILRLRNVSWKECWTIVYGMGTGPLISIIYKNSWTIFPVKKGMFPASKIQKLLFIYLFIYKFISFIIINEFIIIIIIIIIILIATTKFI